MPHKGMEGFQIEEEAIRLQLKVPVPELTRIPRAGAFLSSDQDLHVKHGPVQSVAENPVGASGFAAVRIPPKDHA